MKFHELKDLCENRILGVEIVRYFTIGFEDAAFGDREKRGEFNGFVTAEKNDLVVIIRAKLIID